MTTSSQTPARVGCYRFPCDTAYHRGTHTPNHEGRVLHQVTWAKEARRVADDTRPRFTTAWATRAIAWDDEPWAAHIDVEAGRRTFTSTDDARRFLEGLQLALVCALEANAKEANSRASDAERDVEELEGLLVAAEKGAKA